MQLIDSLLRAVCAVVDDESLASALDRLLCDDVEDGAELGEGGAQGGYEGGDLDFLVQAADLDIIRDYEWR